MDLTFERRGNVLGVRGDGRLDATTVVAFEEALRDEIEPQDVAVIVDFQQLAFISSAGLRIVLLTAKLLGRQDATLSLWALSDPILEVFRVTGFDQLLRIHDTVEEARASLGA